MQNLTKENINELFDNMESSIIKVYDEGLKARDKSRHTQDYWFGVAEEQKRIVAILKETVANGNKFMSMKDAINEAIAAIEAKEQHGKDS